MGCGDGLLFILKSIEAINELGNMGASSDVWGGVNDNDAQALEFLLRYGATSFDNSKLSVKEFQTVLGHLYGCKLTMARSHFYRLKRQGFVDSRQDGQYDTRVWLTYIPKDVILDSKNYDPYTIPDVIVQGVRPKNDVLIPCKLIFSDDKEEKIVQGDKGIGVMGCIFATCVCSLMYKNKNNNYIQREFRKGYPHTPSPLSPCYVGNPVVEDKTSISGYQNTQKASDTLKLEEPTTDSPNSMIGQVGLLDNQESDRDVQYWEAKETQSIAPCDRQKVLDTMTETPNITLQELISRFGSGVMQLKKEGLIK
jgi:hypothetical protein